MGLFGVAFKCLSKIIIKMNTTTLPLALDSGSHDALADCYDCPHGQYRTSSMTTGCVECPHGKYQDEPEKTACIDCPAGRCVESYN